MTIEHVAACDSCGENGIAVYEGLRAEGLEEWIPPARWITLAGLAFHARHFCSWPCVGRYVTQKIREAELEPPLSPRAEIMLLVMAANGGTMDRADLERECERVWRMSSTERAAWRERIRPLVLAHARRHLAGEGEE